MPRFDRPAPECHMERPSTTDAIAENAREGCRTFLRTQGFIVYARVQYVGAPDILFTDPVAGVDFRAAVRQGIDPRASKTTEGHDSLAWGVRPKDPQHGIDVVLIYDPRDRTAWPVCAVTHERVELAPGAVLEVLPRAASRMRAALAARS